MSKPSPEKADPSALNLPATPGQNPADAMAAGLLHPAVGGAMTARAFSKKYGDGLELNALVRALSEQSKAVHGGDLKRAETMLTAQAHTLDAIFNELAQRAAMNMGEYLGACETYLRLALKAQSQCRTTLETLAAIKNPPAVFAKQANVTTGPQQINNGILAPSRARENENTPNKLLEASDDERLDATAAGAAGGTHPELVPVGTINGTKDTDRKGGR